MKRALRLSGRTLAALLALSMAAPALAGVEAAASCCCAHAQRRCHCPVCEHARALESGRPHLQQCSASHAAARLPALPDMLPPLRDAAAALPSGALPSRKLPALSKPPPFEVPTPPPLA
jgi:hypothetical protein